MKICKEIIEMKKLLAVLFAVFLGVTATAAYAGNSQGQDNNCQGQNHNSQGHDQQ